MIHAFTIPRAVCVIAGGKYTVEIDAESAVIIEVSASLDNPDWQIIQSPFIRENAVTTGFRQRFVLGEELISYQQTTLVDIYEKEGFEHTDENSLQHQ
ncbi:MAG: hypothetical protein GY896_15330 [Gammaproteobacteria bacterium]|nr:hypothetical protein [Gammaproteobacteria bacterium]